MKTISKFSGLFTAFIISALIFGSCASSKSSVSNDSVTLKYKYLEGESYSYLQNANMVQTITFMGQEMSSVVNTAVGLTIKQQSNENGMLSLDTTVDTLGISVDAAQGSFSTDFADIKGKQFTFKLSELGEESGLSEAEGIKYNIAGQESNLKNMILQFFPDLPLEPVKTGYTWNDSDTIDISTATESASMVIHSTNIITGKELVNGLNCFVIHSQFTGTRDSGSDTPQGYISTVGDISGEGTIYFAISEGVLVKDNNSVRVIGSVNIPTGESIPMDIKTEYTTLLKK